MRKTAVYILVLALIVLCTYGAAVPAAGMDTATDSLLRFHVIANSDSPADQALKHKVKDRIINEIGAQVAGMDDKQELLEYLTQNTEYIEGIARQEVQNSSKEYQVKAEIGYFPFPVKSYGGVTLPAGNYHALRLVLGDGGGANWWCVMFPPLCFVDTKNAVALAKDQQRIKDMLTQQELDALSSSDNIEQVPVRLRFKLAELLNASRTKLAKLGSGLKYSLFVLQRPAE
jgi:stage II sporulation protein R